MSVLKLWRARMSYRNRFVFSILIGACFFVTTECPLPARGQISWLFWLFPDQFGPNFLTFVREVPTKTGLCVPHWLPTAKIYGKINIFKQKILIPMLGWGRNCILISEERGWLKNTVMRNIILGEDWPLIFPDFSWQDEIMTIFPDFFLTFC